MVINATLLKNASLIVMSVYPAPGRVAFMPGNGAGEIPGPSPEIASDLPGPGTQKLPGPRLGAGYLHHFYLICRSLHTTYK